LVDKNELRIILQQKLDDTDDIGLPFRRRFCFRHSRLPLGHLRANSNFSTGSCSLVVPSAAEKKLAKALQRPLDFDAMDAARIRPFLTDLS
jgi:hypothetical protein